MPQKCEDALIWQVVVIKRLNIGKPENHTRDDRPTLSYKIRVVLGPISRFHIAPVGGIEQTTACYDVSRDSSPCLFKYTTLFSLRRPIFFIIDITEIDYKLLFNMITILHARFR